jgi:hypothetical protein
MKLAGFAAMLHVQASYEGGLSNHTPVKFFK